MSTPSSPAAQATPEPDLSGKTLGDYQLFNRLGRGGMADVYRAEQKSLRRQVAFKVLKRSLADDETYVRRFHREAQAAASLVHANIVQIHEVGFLEGRHFIAQEYVSGHNLRQEITRNGPLSVSRAIKVMRQVASALHKAAEKGIIHRDIKPENILIHRDEVKVADFGLAHVTTDTQVLNLTQVGITMGTPLYMSPEQVEGRAVDPRSDIYSFGVTCFQMLAGRPPFEAETALGVAIQHLKKEPERLEEIRPELPPALCRIVHRMLAKDPGQRYQRASDLLRDLKQLPIDGQEDEWSPELDPNSADEPSAANAGTAATQQLAVLMKREAERRSAARRAFALVLGLIVASILVALLVAWLTAPPPLLGETSDTTPAVPRQPDALAQYYLAVEQNSEEAWQSVWQYFPPSQEPQLFNERYTLLAKLRLAEFYRDQQRLDEAVKVYREVAGYESTDRQYRGFALAGLANLYARRDDSQRVQETLQRLSHEVLPQIDDRYHEQIRQQLDAPLQPTLQQYLAQQQTHST